MNNEINKKQLLDFAQELNNKGFQVYAPVNITTYFNFVKDNKIGYVERGDYGFNFSTVHKPCRECGTGYSMYREVSEPTIKMAIDCFAFAPNWAYPSELKAIRKYKNWEEYINYPVNKIIPQVEL